MLNHISIMGRLTRDPELRYTQSGTAVASFTVAVDRDYAAQGQQRETDFIDCVAWRQGGEFVSKYFSKGSMIVVDGRLQSRKWQDRDGNNRTSWEILVDHSYFGESKKDNQGGGQSTNYQNNSYASRNRGVDVSADGFDDFEEDGFQELSGDDSNNPFTQPQQTGMFDDFGDGDGELPF